jgi:predicted ATPase
MQTSVIEELRLGAFKSFRDAKVQLSDLTLLIGRNGSGKSNLLDALEVLSRLATGDDVRDVLDGGRRDMGPVRGGVEGCAPRGSTEFEIGCLVRTGHERASLDVRIQVEPHVQVLRERLCGQTRIGWRTLLETAEPDPERGDIDAHWWNGRRGVNPSLPFRSSRLLTAQVPTRVPLTTEAGRQVHRSAEEVLQALTGVFHLDPVPHLMRQYVPERDIVLRRTAENLSAVIRHLKTTDRASFDELLDLLRALPDHELKDLVVERSGLGDVMLATKERQQRRNVIIPARLMSDGMLRFLAIATALLTASQQEVLGKATDEVTGGRTLVIEELENGLHPSQAARVLELLVRQAREQSVQTLATTHSPALLSALTGADHDGVVVCDRDPKSGLSRVRRLPDLPGYASAMAGGSLGEVMTKGLLQTPTNAQDLSEFDQLFGIG